MDTTGQQNRKKKALIIAGVAMGIVIVGVIIVVAMMGGSSNQQRSASSVTVGDTEVTAKNENLQHDLEELSSTLKQAETDRAAAIKALEASKKQVTITDAKASLRQLKDSATKELDRRSTALKGAKDKLGVSAEQAKSAANSKITITGTEGLTIVKGKIASAIDGRLSELMKLKQTVQGTSKLSDLQTAAKTIDSSYAVDQALYAQAVVAKAVTSTTVVTSALSVVKGSLRTAAEQACDSCTGDDAQQSDLQTQIATAAGMLETVKSNSSSAVVLLSAMTTTLASLPSGYDASGLLNSLEATNSQLTIIGTLAESMRQEFTALASSLDA